MPLSKIENILVGATLLCASTAAIELGSGLYFNSRVQYPNPQVVRASKIEEEIRKTTPEIENLIKELQNTEENEINLSRRYNELALKYKELSLEYKDLISQPEVSGIISKNEEYRSYSSYSQALIFPTLVTMGLIYSLLVAVNPRWTESLKRKQI